MGDFTDRSQFRVDDLLVIPERNIVIRSGQEIKLEPRMMQVLVMLAEHSGETLSPERLLIDVWGCTADDDSPVYGDSSVSRAISLMRKALHDDSRKPRYIETVSKAGYRLIPPVSLSENYRRMPAERWTEGSPYVGLSAFDSDHASVFCGRSRIIADLLKAMRTQIDNQRRFVLIVGASGCGKTSLLRAGAIPLLTKPGGFEGLHAVSVAACDLAANGRDPLIPLIEALAAWTVDERPVFPPQTPAQLEMLLTKTPAVIEGFVNEAFRRDPKRDLVKQPYSHLLLIIDHAEALVATSDIDIHSRDSFAQIVQALCACPHIVVTMIARGDFYQKLIEALPVLAEYKAGDGHLDVMAPRHGEIGEIIRSPAWKADLSFETHPVTRTRLDDELRDKALAQPDALPLLQHTLQTLYERRNDKRQLTFSAYNDIGGLEGAIAHRAEEVFASLSTIVQMSLDTVLARLIVMQPGSEVVTARRARIDTLSDDAKVLVEAFIRGRLFVSEMHDDGPRFGVVHEALLRQWPRTAKWTMENGRLLMAKANFEHAADLWERQGRQHDHLLNPGRPLIEAREVKQRYAEDIGEVEIALLRASEKMGRRKRLLSHIAIGALVALSVTSTYLAAVAESNRKKAMDLIGYMLVGLSDQLRPTASTSAMKSISIRALDFLENQPVNDMSSGEMINYSRALRTRGEVFSLEGEDGHANKLFHRADDVAERAMRMTPSSTQAIAEAGQTAYWLGLQSYNAGDADTAQAQWMRYFRHSEQLRKLESKDPDWRQEAAFSTANLGMVDRMRGDCESALKKFDEAIKLIPKSSENNADDESRRYGWIVVRSMVSRCHAEEGRIIEASHGYKQQIIELKDLLEKRPDAIKWEKQLASLLHFNAGLSLALGDIENAENQYLDAINRLTLITKIQPSNQEWKHGLANALMRKSEIDYMYGDTDAAMTHLRIAMRLSEEGKAAEDGNNWQRLSAIILFKIGRYSTSSDSERTMSSAIESIQKLVDANPADDYAKKVLAEMLISRGISSSDSGMIASARQDWERARSTIHKIAIGTSDPDMIASWVNVNILLGKRTEMEASIQTLTASGYAHPDFVNLEMQTRK